MKNTRMLFEIRRVQPRTMFRILSLLLLLHNISCISGKSAPPTEDNLILRINQFNSYFQNEDYQKLFEFSLRKSVDKRAAIKSLKEDYRIRITSYKIDTIARIDEFKAKVIMVKDYIHNGIHNEKSYYFNQYSVDCWCYKKGNWYPMTMDRTLDWQCQDLARQCDEPDLEDD
jgi:hypothetical protein